MAKLMRDSWWFWDNFQKISKSTVNSTAKKYFLGKLSEHFHFLHIIKMIIIDRVAHTKIVDKKTQLELH